MSDADAELFKKMKLTVEVQGAQNNSNTLRSVRQFVTREINRLFYKQTELNINIK